jgi:hypothetical protein
MYALLDCNAIQLGDSPTFRRNISPPSSGSRNTPASPSFLFSLLFDPEYAGHMFLRNVELSPKLRGVPTQRTTLHCHGCGNLKSYIRSVSIIVRKHLCNTKHDDKVTCYIYGDCQLSLHAIPGVVAITAAPNSSSAETTLATGTKHCLLYQ